MGIDEVKLIVMALVNLCDGVKTSVKVRSELSEEYCSENLHASGMCYRCCFIIVVDVLRDSA